MPTPTEPTEGTPEAHTRAGSCPVAWCPICLAVSVVDPLAPEVVSHLLKAGTELFLAFQSVIEDRGEDLEPTGEQPEPLRLEKIDIG
jgi:hypothetical protein